MNIVEIRDLVKNYQLGSTVVPAVRGKTSRFALTVNDRRYEATVEVLN